MMLSRSIRFSAQAVEDFDQLGQYSLETWGEPQQAEYGNRLLTAMRELAQYPSLGASRKLLMSGLRVLPVA